MLKFEKRPEPARWAELTPREREACILRIAHGKSVKETAAAMRVSEHRVKTLTMVATRVLRVGDNQHDLNRLAFWMGVHWTEIEKYESEFRLKNERVGSNHVA